MREGASSSSATFLTISIPFLGTEMTHLFLQLNPVREKCVPWSYYVGYAPDQVSAA